jgi:hypothetical protein
LPKYLKSFLICLPCWAACCGIIVAFLNITGAIRPEHHGGALDIPCLSHLADPGQICDPEGNFNMVMSIAQAIITTILNGQFRRIAHYTSELENHKTESTYARSVFVKRFIFECTDFHMYLLYIGLYQQNIGLLRTNLIATFMVDEVRRVVTESVLPYLC